MNQENLEIINEIQRLASELAEEVYVSPFDKDEIEQYLTRMQTYCDQLDLLEKEAPEES